MIIYDDECFDFLNLIIDVVEFITTTNAIQHERQKLEQVCSIDSIDAVISIRCKKIAEVVSLLRSVELKFARTLCRR